MDDVKISDTIFIEAYDVGIVEYDTGIAVSVFMIRVWEKVTLDRKNYEFFNVKETGDGFRDKICNICHKLLPTTNFAKNQNGKDNRTVRRPSCQDCRKHLEGVSTNPTDKRAWGERKPNYEPFECPICNKRTIAGVTCKVVLDHNHKTGEARGWICDSCNTGIGRFKDDAELLKKAIKFLE